jgi:hypothetical protein
MMKPRWVEAGGTFQILFMVAAGQALKGGEVACPKCAAPHLRHYFHVLDRRADTGSVWIWCDNCRTHSHLPRVRASSSRQRDPFAGVDDEAFAALEMDRALPFLDRLNGLWNDGRLAPSDEDRQP